LVNDYAGDGSAHDEFDDLHAKQMTRYHAWFVCGECGSNGHQSPSERWSRMQPGLEG